ncbi:hypothetical protein BBJ28_00009670, partial [Nothophytophthora sp. Chile5]
MAASPTTPYTILVADVSPALLESGYSRESGKTAPNANSDYLNSAPNNSLHCRAVAAKYEDITNPCVLSWSNLSYAVKGDKTPKNPEGKKTILDKVSGRCAPGELTAIMGPSGSGKTTLVDLLADRISSGDVSGAIELNGEPRVTKTFRAVTSYVAQEDSLLGSFTVLETMRMAAKLSLPNSVSSAEIEARVDAVVDE